MVRGIRPGSASSVSLSWICGGTIVSLAALARPCWDGRYLDLLVVDRVSCLTSQLKHASLATCPGACRRVLEDAILEPLGDQRTWSRPERMDQTVEKGLMVPRSPTTLGALKGCAEHERANGTAASYSASDGDKAAHCAGLEVPDGENGFDVAEAHSDGLRSCQVGTPRAEYQAQSQSHARQGLVGSILEHLGEVRNLAHADITRISGLAGTDTKNLAPTSNISQKVE
jgi:hypothetical protein